MFDWRKHRSIDATNKCFLLSGEGRHACCLKSDLLVGSRDNPVLLQNHGVRNDGDTSDFITEGVL